MSNYAEVAPIAINFTVDVDQGVTTSPQVLRVQQGEHNARYLQVSLVHNGSPINLNNSEVHFLTQPYKSNEIPTTTNCKIYDAESGMVMVAIRDYMTNKSGIINGEFVRIGEDGSALPFKNFSISVDGSIFVNEGLGQSESLHSLVSALARVQRVEEYLEQEFMDVEAKYAGELSKTNAQLSVVENKKVNKDDFTSELSKKRNKSDSISMQDLHTEVKQAMTGGSVAVVGENAVGKENIKSNAVTYTKVDHSIMKNPLTNLISTDLYKGTGKNGGVIEEQSDGSFILTSTSTYGTFNRIINVEEHRTYLCISKVKLIEGSSVMVRHICYNYSQSNANLGAFNGNQILLTDDYQTLTTKIDMKPTSVLGHFGVCVGKECVIQIKDQIILDVTGISDDVLGIIDFNSYNGGYWEDVVDNVVITSEVSKYSYQSERAKTSEFALSCEMSDKSKISDYALDGNFVKPTEQYSNIIGGFTKLIENNNEKVWGNGAKVNVLTDTKEFEFTPSASWGELLFWTPIKSGTTDTPILNGRSYKFVAKVKGSESTKLKCSCFIYSQNGTQLGSISGGLMTCKSEYQYLTFGFTINKEDSYKVAIGTTTQNNPDLHPYVIKDVMLIDVTDTPLSDNDILDLGGYWSENPQIVANAIHSKTSDVSEMAKTLSPDFVFPQQQVSKWRGKTVLVIGDSITAALKWQKKLSEDLGMIVKTHAKGGVGILAMVDGDKGLQGDYDNETNASGTLYPLNVNDVTGVDLIICLPAYNERGREYGVIGDCYPTHSNIIGLIQYMINRIYEELAKANNLDCKILFATPHCAGKYNYVDADGYDEYPSGSGRTMETMSDTIKMICNHNNIPVCDLWHNSGINKFTWTIYGSQQNAVNEQYTKYELNAQGEIVGTSPMKYTKGQSYYQIRDGQVVLEEYTGSAPYPFNGDQLHCSNLGYSRIGECIVGSVIRSYGY